MVSAVIIDDEGELVEIFSEYFTLENIDILATGKNGKEAVELCIKHSPDFLILDLNMGEYNGFYALENLDKEKKMPHVIVITGEIDNQIEKLKPYDDIILLSKPLDLPKIVNTMKGIRFCS